MVTYTSLKATPTLQGVKYQGLPSHFRRTEEAAWMRGEISLQDHKNQVALIQLDLPREMQWTNLKYHVMKKLWCSQLTILQHDLFPKKMEFLFGSRKTPEEMLKQNQRALNRAMRELDREKSKLEQQEKKIIADIKKMAKQGQMVGQTTPLVSYCELSEFKRAGLVIISRCRTQSRSWPRIWFAPGATSRSSS